MQQYQPYGQRDYPYLRSVIAPEYATLPAAQLEAFMERQFGEGAAEAYDEYLEFSLSSIGRDIGRFASRAAPVVANIGGGVVRGATAGAALGLPGIIGGAVAGGVGQGFASYGGRDLRRIGSGINTGVGLAGQFSPTGRIGASLGGAVSSVGQGRSVGRAATTAATGLLGQLGGPAGALGRQAGAGGQAANQIAALLGRREFAQALAAMGMGTLGRQTIPVGSAQTPVPTSAFANLLGVLANRAADEQAALSDGGESDLRYLTNDVGEWVADPADHEERAEHLASLLDLAEDERSAQLDQQQLMQQYAQLQQLAMQQAQQLHAQQLQAQAWQQAEFDELAEWDELGAEAAYDEWDEYDEYDEFDEYALAPNGVLAAYGLV
jgi:hypothetical protein